MRSRLPAVLLALCAAMWTTGPPPARAQAQHVAYVKPQFLPPAELARILGVRAANGHELMEWRAGSEMHAVEVRRNDAANLVILAGAAEDVAAAETMLKAADVAPRQIMVEARIVEVDENKALDAGIDWPRLRGDVQATESFVRQTLKQEFELNSSGPNTQRSMETRNLLGANANLSMFDVLRLLEQKGAATFRNAPRILTLNNRRATILDGQRVTYVTRYSSFTNLFETDTLDAGLTLSVLPSLGESGYLTLDLRAELTSVSGDISGSPIKDGQIVENTVIVRDGETVLLGGFLRTVEERSRRRFPLLGTVLPFLFSREISTKTRRESFVAVTPHVVDLATAVDAKTKGVLDGR